MCRQQPNDRIGNWVILDGCEERGLQFRTETPFGIERNHSRSFKLGGTLVAEVKLHAMWDVPRNDYGSIADWLSDSPKNSLWVYAKPKEEQLSIENIARALTLVK